MDENLKKSLLAVLEYENLPLVPPSPDGLTPPSLGWMLFNSMTPESGETVQDHIVWNYAVFINPGQELQFMRQAIRVFGTVQIPPANDLLMFSFRKLWMRMGCRATMFPKNAEVYSELSAMLNRFHKAGFNVDPSHFRY